MQSDTKSTVVIAEGLWRNPGQPPKSLILAAIRKNGLWEKGVCFDTVALENIHGFWGLLPNQDDPASSMLFITFHHTNRSTYDLKTKKLFWKKGGVWMDINHYEAFIMQAVRSR